MHAYLTTEIRNAPEAEEPQPCPRQATEHDRACQYLMEPAVYMKLIAPFRAAFVRANTIRATQPTEEPAGISGACEKVRHAFVSTSCSTGAVAANVEVSRRWGGERRPAGWLDVVVTFQMQVHRKGFEWCEAWNLKTGHFEGMWPGDPMRGVDAVELHTVSVIVEVKTSHTSTGDFLKQIKNYGEMRHPAEKVYRALATTYPLNEIDVTMLAKEGVKHYELGADFAVFRALHDANNGTRAASSVVL